MDIVIKGDSLSASILLTDEDRVLERIDTKSPSILGNIYKGRVLRCLEKFSALSVDIGEYEPGFLPMSENKLRKYLQGTELLVQVSADGREGRGARLTTEISLPGFYTILLFGDTRGTLGISKKIKSEEKIAEIKRILTPLKKPHRSIIARTESESVCEEELKRELEGLENDALRLEKDFNFYAAPKLLLSAGTVDRALKRLWSGDVSQIAVEDDELFTKLYETLPQALKNILIKAPKGRENLTETNACDMPTSFTPGSRVKIPLKSGGNIVIERTEACTVVDVNSGNTDSGGKKATLELTNKEAAYEVMKALRRLSISGMIVIDFIDVVDDNKNHKEELENILSNCAESDSAKVKLFGFTAMGLYELTRKARR